MNILPISQQNFKGYDARPLKGFLMSSNCHGIADEMAAIGKKENFKIFTAYDSTRGGTGEFIPPYKNSTEGLWAQDFWMMVKDKLMVFDCDKKSDSIKNFFKLKYDFTEKIVRETEEYTFLNNRLRNIMLKVFENPAYLSEYNAKQMIIRELQDNAHIAGGNIYLINNGKEDEVLVGEYELDKYTPDEIGGMYCANKVIAVPQMDFHLDLFIRPLDKKRILLADDNLTLDVLKKHSSKYAKSFQYEMENNQLAKTDDVAKILENNGYEIIRVPGRIYVEGLKTPENNVYLGHKCNYINANVLKNSKGDLVYITNKSDINKEVGFDFEKEFIDSISPYIKKEKIYFIHGKDNFVARKMLRDYHGGIHCTCTEVL